MRKPRLRHLFLPLMLAGLIVSGWSWTVAQAQSQPTAVNPTARAVSEKELLEALKPGAAGTQAVNGRVSIPDQRSGNLIQPAGKDWRTSRDLTVPYYGGIAILGMLALLTLFYIVRGRIRMEGGRSGVTITRFKFIERFGHWLTAVSFIALGLTGLNLTFGRSILMPLIGPNAFASLTQFGKLVHNYGSFAFALGLLFLMWIKDNIPHPRDILWLLKGGGMFGLHVDAARFNAGQKIIFWVVILGGAALSATGYLMMFGAGGIADMQYYNIVHALIGAIMVAVIIAHIYIGSLGMEGAFEAMGSGEVDLNWARSHHSIWAERQLAQSSKKIAPAE
jgi:formate dehydrogenase subunit gamma